MLPKKRKLLYLWKIYGDLCVLDCIVGNVPLFYYFFFFSKSVLYWVIVLRY